MRITKESLLFLLDDARISYIVYEHPPVFTVKEAASHCAEISGVHVKNLFLRDKKKTQYILVTLQDEKQVDLTALGKLLNLDRLSFANNIDLNKMLGVEPGSVTPVAILNDEKIQVRLYMDNDLLQHEYINVHPMENIATLHLKTSELVAFIENRYDRPINWIDVPVKNNEEK